MFAEIESNSEATVAVGFKVSQFLFERLHVMHIYRSYFQTVYVCTQNDQSQQFMS